MASRGFLLFYGLLFIIIGIGGFVPQWVEEEFLWDAFKVNTLLNIIHIAAGTFAWMVFFLKPKMIRLYYQIAGIFFIFLSLLGFAYDYKPIFHILPSNPTNTWFHMIMGLLGLVLGFVAYTKNKKISK